MSLVVSASAPSERSWALCGRLGEHFLREMGASDGKPILK